VVLIAFDLVSNSSIDILQYSATLIMLPTQILSQRLLVPKDTSKSCRNNHHAFVAGVSSFLLVCLYLNYHAIMETRSEMLLLWNLKSLGTSVDALFLDLPKMKESTTTTTMSKTIPTTDELWKASPQNENRITATTTTTNTPPKAATTQDTLFPSVFRKTAGNGWKLWHDSDTPLSVLDTSNWTCHWQTFRPFVADKKRRMVFHKDQQLKSNTTNTNTNTNTSTTPKSYSYSTNHNNTSHNTTRTVQMCTHDPKSEDIWVSRGIQALGRWKDCDSLTHWYEKSHFQNTTTNNNTSSGWYIDIGANIGSCVLQVLLTTNARIVAFEPDPRNLWHLTSTLAQLEPHLRKRVYVFPVALGDATGTSEIHVAADNRGNAIVGQSIQDRDTTNQTFLEPMSIQVERMDDLIDGSNQQQDNNSIRLVKLDAQGYECNIVRGMHELLAVIPTVVFELEMAMLRAFPNCSEQVLWDTFAQAPAPAEGKKFAIYNDFLVASGLPKVLAQVKSLPTSNGVNLVATRS